MANSKNENTFGNVYGPTLAINLNANYDFSTLMESGVMAKRIEKHS